MEELLKLLIKDAQAAKFQPIRQAAQNALDVLNNKDDVERLPAHMLRERCLEPLHLALESKTKRLMTHAVSGIEKLLKDDRFQSSMETESEDKWLPIQILKTVYSTPNLPEDIQTDVMKLLLKMTFSTAWCMNSRIITQVAQVYIDTYSSSSTTLKGIVQAALTQLLGSFAEKLRSAMQKVEHAEEDVMSHFNAKGDPKVESLTDDVVTLLNFLTEKVSAAAKAGKSKQAVPLLLEGILAIVSNSPVQLRNCEGFQQLVWQNLCPTLISLLGIPRAEPKPKAGGDAQRNVDTTNLTAATAKIIYSISVEVAKMVGPVKSLRPVLETLFHRILICSSPNNRHDALKALKELLADPTRLCDITVTYYDDCSRSGKSTTQINDLALVKLIVDSVQECCHTSDSALCYTCVMCVGDLLTSIEHLDRGIGIHGESVKVIKEKYLNKHDKERTVSDRANSIPCHSDTEEAVQNVNNCSINNSINGHSDNDQLDDKIENKDTDGKLSKEKYDSAKFVEHNGEKSSSLSHYKSAERQSALDFIQEMVQHLPYLLSLTTIPEVDEALQKFSSQFSQNSSKMCNKYSDGDLYGVPVTPVIPVAPRINVPALIRQSSIESGWDRSISGGGMLNSVQASQALCGLSQQVDRLFEEAANNLNMTSLTAFLASLCESSKHQLHKITKTILEEEDFPGEHHNLPVNSLHLYRLQNVLMKVAHSDRPLIHLIKAWSVVSSYLVESAGHKDRSISKMAVTCVHDFMIAVMTGHSELQHFHTNEMLCKTFENILCLELCDGDVQDQIVCSICELVEASASDIRSGWRPLFGALRAVRIEYTTVEEVNEARQRHVEAVLDVFDVYLNTDNILVFANATVDCILCLLKYVRGPGEFEDSDTEDGDSVSDYMTSSPASENLVLPALNYLKQCCIILQSMWKMPACPVFHGAKRIQVDTASRCVDRDIPNMDFKKFSKYFILDDERCDQLAADKSPSHEYIEKTTGDSSSLLSNDSGILLTASKEDSKPETSDCNIAISLDELDNHTGILHVWFLMLEGLSGAICACPRSYQPHTMETMFDLLRSASHVPDDEKVCRMIEEVLKQLLIVLTECVAQPFEVISRLGCSCIRHILLSAHTDFTEGMWKIVIDSLENALDVTTYCLRQLMLLFKTNSENFYGDIGQVKVATRKDCTMMEFVRIWHLAQQVFLLDSQVSVEVPSVDSTEDKSYVFLLYPPGYENSLNPDHILARVPFRSIVVGLLSHQLLLQTVGCILLEGTDTPDSHMPGMLSQLATKHVMQLLECLRNSYKLACEFDTRPGLKFLVQKVAHTPVAVNLYKQAGASMVFYIHTLIKICANIPDLDKEIVRALLLKETKNVTSEDDEIADDTSPSQETGIVDKSDEESGNHGNIPSNDSEISKSSKSDNSVEEESNDTAAVGESEKGKIVGDTAEKKGAKLTDNAKVTENSVELCSQIIINNPKMFVSQLKTVCDELCQTYIDILYDKSGTSCVDSMSDQQLFFLIAQPDEFPELPAKHKVDANQLSKELEETQARLQGQGQIVPLQAVSVQENGSTVSPVAKQEKESVLPPLSPVHSHTKSKREMRTEQESRVYNLATDKLIKNLMTEYKKRKNQNAMPTFAKVNKKDNSDKKLKKKQGSSDPVEQVIEEQQHTSIMKDSEAHLQSWTELLCTILGLFDQLDDRKFTTLLPAVFECVNHLICHAHDMRLREELARWLHRVGDIYTLGPKME
ncbi:brefeldin A-inhibited guanine nucleotide-exchange protein 3-like [Mercenaria mercenaria]|uniref:brefeldin A-inhibited guanine nucleotide-exchange protein 3-like n=1 Tax=Mercenaria mercenaria TaxID=6596 RepID=UPI00234ECB81|nr:brefeldin A-inhibited guanine nucleotide-exchange protein 3-like [Mercenaria mercenaria]